ncbi:ATP-dependent Clp protease ATP-binding subunit [Streptomyces sp. B6B3]|uniref:ATP-dependent Clp protease ATP-binding subunit n=1 Tax=Streptomyces sp. B6B3 TaxID=3153570 RepID=UPI00325F65C1
MTMSPFGPSPDPFSELLDRFFGMSPAASPPAVQRVPTGRLLSDAARDLISRASERAAAGGGVDLGTEHLLWAATSVEPSRGLLAAAGADPEGLAADIAAALPGGGPPPAGEPGLTPAAKRTLTAAHARSGTSGVSYIGPEHILGALLDDPDSGAGRMLRQAHLDTGQLSGARRHAGSPEFPEFPEFPETSSGPEPLPGPWGPGSYPLGSRPPSATPTLDRYGRDLTAEARTGRLDPVVGRAAEIEQTIEILGRRTRNNPALVGEPGVGRTAVVAGLAQRIVSGDVPEPLAGRRVVALDLPGLVAGARHRGELEERLRAVVAETAADGPAAPGVLLFVDALATAVGAVDPADAAEAAGAPGRLAGPQGFGGEILGPALARGELRVIGAITPGAYRRHVAADPALERRFQPVPVAEPDVAGTVRILTGLRDAYEAHHQVRFADEALTAAARLADRYLVDRRLPDKAIDLLDQAGARVRLAAQARTGEDARRRERLAQLNREKDQAIAGEEYERAADLRKLIGELEDERAPAEDGGAAVTTVTAAAVAEVVARRTGIPVPQLVESDRDRLLKLGHALRERVVGQEEAVAAVAEALRRNGAGMVAPGRPAAAFLFLGPAGVGRAELARALAEVLYGSADRLTRFGADELQGPEAVARMAWTVSRQPHGVLLLDGIERAHPEVVRALLRVLDGAPLPQRDGGAANARGVVLVVTSTLDPADLGGTAGAGGAEALAGVAGLAALRERVDETVVFHRLRPDELDRVVALLLRPSEQRVRERGMRLDVTPAARRLLAEHGHRAETGARPLSRAIHQELDGRIAALLLADGARVGDTIIADVSDGELVCAIGGGADDTTNQAEADAEAEGWPPAA